MFLVIQSFILSRLGEMAVRRKGLEMLGGDDAPEAS